MRRVLTLTMKELRQMFLSPIAYAFMMVFVAFVTYMFFRTFFLAGQASLARFFEWFPVAYVLLVPGIVMRVWSEERKQGTLEFLLTSPAETWQVVLAKFLAGTTLVALCVLLTLWVPRTVAQFGDLDPGPVWGGYIGAILMGATFVAIGMFCSAFTADQNVSFLVSVAVLFIVMIMGHWWFQTGMGPGSWFGVIGRHLSPTSHFESIGRGVIDIRDVFYFVATTGVFLYLNTRLIELQRWR